MLKFSMPTFCNGRNNSKTACVCLYRVPFPKYWVIRLCLRRRVFKRGNHVPGIPPDCDRVAEKLARLHLRLFPLPFSNHTTECSGIVAEGTSICRFKSANFSDCGPISACATDTRIQPEYSVLFSMFSGEFCLRLKPYLVKIAPDDRTVLSSMRSGYDFCRSDCRLWAGKCGKSGNSS